LSQYARFETNDPEEVLAALARLMDREIERLTPHREFHLTVHTAALELLTVSAVEAPGGLAVDLHHVSYSLARAEIGRIDRRSNGGAAHAFHPGAGYLASPKDEASMLLPILTQRTASVAIGIPASLLEREAEMLIGEPVREPLVIDGALDLGPLTHIGQRVDQILDELERGHEGVFRKRPLVGRECQRKLIEALILHTQNNYHRLLERHYGGRARGHVARMEDYIAAHLRDAVTVADLAHAAGVSARTLRDSCHRIRAKSPEEILREMRLHAVHGRMEFPEPTDTVTSIAYEYHFLNMGRFADYYRRQFHGEAPGETLHRGRKRRAILAGPLDELGGKSG
jgi:AraC-like DNA-binding protein